MEPMQAQQSTFGQQPSFADTVRELLDSTEDVIKVHHTTTVEAAALKELLRAMAQKIHLQDLEMDRLRDVVDALQQEVRYLRSNADQATQLRGDVRKLGHDVEGVVAQQRVQAQRVDKLRAEVEDVQVDLSKALYGGGGGGAPSATATSRVPAGVLHTPIGDSTPIGGGATQRGNLFSSPLGDSGFGAVSFTPPPSHIAPIGAPPGLSPTPGTQRPVAGLDIADGTGGIKVVAVKPGGPANAAGIEVGDVIVRANNKPMRTKAEFIKLLEQCVPGQGIDISHKREGFSSIRSSRIFLAPK